MHRKVLGRLLLVGSLIVLLSMFAATLIADRPENRARILASPAGAPWFNAPAGASGAATPPAYDSQPPPENLVSVGPVAGISVQQDISPPLRDIPPVVVPTPTGIREMGVPGEVEQIGPIDLRPPIDDPVLQTTFSATPANLLQPMAPSPLINFEGVNNIDLVYPPDTVGEVGPNHFVQMVNLHFAIWDKSGNKLYGPAASNTIWNGFGGPCQTRNDGDPIVLYDQLANRWILSQFTSASPYGECVAVSQTGDPTGAYYRYFFTFNSSTSQFYDYPKLAVWPDGYYLTANRFGSVYMGASAIVLERAKMLAGQAARYVEFQTSISYGSLMPADLDGATPPPSGSPNFIMQIGSTALRLWKLHIDWVNTANSTFTGPTSLSVASYNTLCSSTRSCIPQPNTSIKLDGIGDRLMFRLAYRNFGSYETMVVNHSVNALSSGAQAAVRWYEIRNPNGAPAIYQQGTYAPDVTHRWMGSIAMDRSGNIAMVYSASSASVFPGIRYTGRLVNDPLGTMPQGETTLIAGAGYQYGTASRWGDYADITVDPLDDCTFWFTSEYIQTSGGAPWQTRIGAFKFPSCGLGSNKTFIPYVIK